MKTVVTHAIGGLGNQFFQYATGLACAILNGASLRIDKSSFSWYRRPFALDAFRIATPCETRTDRIEFALWHGRYSPMRVWDKKCPPVHRRVRVSPTNYDFAPELLNMGGQGKIFLVGHWQNERYFLPVRERLLREFTLRSEYSPVHSEIGQDIAASESVAVHIRRGDNVAKPDPKNPARMIPQLGMVQQAYISSATEKIRGQVPNSRFFVFSDEIDWVKNHFTLPSSATFVPNSFTDVQQFELMRICKHHIIANSTFSWWAAWLNDNPEKVVCAPKLWDIRDPHYDTSGLLPESWLRL